MKYLLSVLSPSLPKVPRFGTCIVLGLVGMRLNFVTYFVTSHYNFKDWQSIYIWFKATKRKTCYSIYIRYPCGNIQGSFILHLYHVLCAWVYVIEIQIAVSYIYTCHVQVSTALSRINYFTKILFDMEAQIVIRNTSISFKHISCGVLLYIIVY